MEAKAGGSMLLFSHRHQVLPRGGGILLLHLSYTVVFQVIAWMFVADLGANIYSLVLQ